MGSDDTVSILGNIALGVLRHFVTTAAGGLVANGYLTHDQAQQGAGAVMVIVALGFSVYDKMKARAAQQAALMTPPPRIMPSIQC